MFPRTRAGWILAYVLLAAGCRSPVDSDSAELSSLGSYRPALPRLTLELGYARCDRVATSFGRKDCAGDLPGTTRPTQWRCSRLPSPGTKAAQALRRASIEAFAGTEPEDATGRQLHRAALLQVLGQADARGLGKAETWLLQALATATAAEKVQILTDLGALRLVLAESTGSSQRLLQSIEDSQEALDADPNATLARFNLALALSEFGVPEAARREWGRFLAREPRGPWADEASRHLAELPPSDGRRRGAEIASRLSAAAEIGSGDALRLAVEDRQRAREWVEGELLPRWGCAWLAGDERLAARSLSAARQLAASIAEKDGDQLLADAVTAIERASPSQRDELAAAHREHGVVLLLSRMQRHADVEARSGAARGGFARGGSPFALWAEFERALAIYHQQRPVEAEAVLRDLASRLDVRRHAALAGRIEWIRGLATSRQDRVEQSNEHYRAAAAHFCRLGENQNLAATEGLLAAGMTKLGYYDAAGTLSHSALRRRDRIFNLQRLQAILQDAANDAHRQGLPRAGLHLAHDLVDVAQRQGSAVTVHDAFLRRAALLGALGREDAARVDLARAMAVLTPPDGDASRADDPDLADARRAAADLRVEEARDLLRTAPVEPKKAMKAVECLDEAIATYRRDDALQRLPQAHGLRAQGRLALGLARAAEDDLIEQVRLLEASLFAAPASALRADRIAVLRDSFDRIVEFRAAGPRRDDAAAFRYAEQERHWALWEWAGAEATTMQRSRLVVNPLAVASWTELQRLQDSDTATLVYHALPDRLLVWASFRDRAVMKHVPIPRQELRSRVAALVAGAGRRDAAGVGQRGAALYSLLVAPVAPVIAGSSRLLIVPDPLFQDLPFGLVRDARGHPLYEGRSLLYSPSATVYTRLARLGDGHAWRGHRVLAVAGTAGRQPAWPRLPGALAEAKAVAAAWRDGEAASFRELEPLRQRLLVADAFHFAGHALVGDGPLRLIAHDDGEQPLELGPADISGELFPRLRLVSLSGCQTIDLRRAGRPRDASAGFVRSLLAAGVPTVVGSFLRLDDRRAGSVFAAFYRRLAGGEDPARAIRSACLQTPFDRAGERDLLCGSLATFGLSAPIGR